MSVDILDDNLEKLWIKRFILLHMNYPRKRIDGNLQILALFGSRRENIGLPVETSGLFFRIAIVPFGPKAILFY